MSWRPHSLVHYEYCLVFKWFPGIFVLGGISLVGDANKKPHYRYTTGVLFSPPNNPTVVSAGSLSHLRSALMVRGE